MGISGCNQRLASDYTATLARPITAKPELNLHSKPSAANRKSATCAVPQPSSKHKKTKGIPYDSAQDGFVFSIEEIQAFVDRTMRHPQAKNLELFLQCGPEKLMAAGR